MIAWSEAITMSDDEFFSTEGSFYWFAMNSNATFFWEIIKDPHVVVARKDVNWNSAISEFGQCAQESRIAARNGSFVFKPEVEQIAY